MLHILNNLILPKISEAKQEVVESQEEVLGSGGGPDSGETPIDHEQEQQNNTESVMIANDHKLEQK